MPAPRSRMVHLELPCPSWTSARPRFGAPPGRGQRSTRTRKQAHAIARRCRRRGGGWSQRDLAGCTQQTVRFANTASFSGKPAPNVLEDEPPMVTTATTRDSNTATWNAQFAALKTRFPTSEPSANKQADPAPSAPHGEPSRARSGSTPRRSSAGRRQDPGPGLGRGRSVARRDAEGDRGADGGGRVTLVEGKDGGS